MSYDLNYLPAQENYLMSSADAADNYAQDVLNLVNAERAKVGLRPLTLSSTLNDGTLIRAQEIESLFSHTRPDGTSCSTVVENSYPSYYLGENIAEGQTSAEEVMTAWMNSTGHRENILRKSYSELGVGLVYDENSYYKYYWVQLFGNPLISAKDSNAGLTFVSNYEQTQMTLQVGNAVTAEIWADSYNDLYTIDAINAQDNPNALILAGTYSNSNTIYGGAGNSSLWGGLNNFNDTLVGGSGSEMFWYGKNDGSDVIQGASVNDTVNLYDINLDAITEINISSNQIFARFDTGLTLTINDGGGLTPTYQLADSSKYKYNHDSGEWINT